MNKLLQHMIAYGDVSDKYLPHLEKYQVKGEVKKSPLLNLIGPKPVYDNIPNPGAMRQQVLMSEKAKQLAALKASQQNRAEVRPAGPKRSAMSKALAVAANPMTAASYVVKGQDIPDNFDRGPLNPYDFATPILNPASIVYAGSRIPGNIQDGEYLEAGLNALAAVPGFTTVPKATRAIINVADRNLSKVGRQLANIEREGKAAGLDKFKIAQRQMNEVGITSNQRQGYVPGVSELARKYITPYGYTGMGSSSKLKEIIENIKKGGVSYYGDELTQPISDARADAWNMYLGFPQRYNTFRMAETAPVNHRAYNKNQLQNMDLYSLNNEAKIADELGRSAQSTTPAGINDAIDNLKADSFVDVDPVDVMGNFNARFTKDGLQYNDIWDLDPSIAPINFIPRSISYKMDYSPLFYRKSYYPGIKDPVYSQRRINVNVSKFLGKPFMSHGNLQSLTAKDYRNNLMENLKNRLAFFTKDPESANMYAPKVEILKDQIKQVNEIDRFRKNGGMIVDPRGQWAHPGKNTMVPTPTGDITMQGVPYPVYGQDETGYGQMMYPGGEYTFPGQMVYETPMMQEGGQRPGNNAKRKKTLILAEHDAETWDQIKDGRKNPFITEADGIRNYLNKFFPNEDVEIIPTYKQNIKEALAKSDPNTRLVVMGHHGDSMFGIPSSEFIQSVANSKYENCYAGICNGDELSGIGRPKDMGVAQAMMVQDNYNKNTSIRYPESYNLNNFYVRAGLPWLGFAPVDRGGEEGFRDAFFRRTTNPEITRLERQYKDIWDNSKEDYEVKMKKSADLNKRIYQLYKERPAVNMSKAANTKELDYVPLPARVYNYNDPLKFNPQQFGSGGEHGGLDRWFAEKWVDIKTGKACGRQEGEDRNYPACRPSRRVSSKTPKTTSEMSPSEKAKFKQSKTSSERISYNHKRN